MPRALNCSLNVIAFHTRSAIHTLTGNVMLVAHAHHMPLFSYIDWGGSSDQ